MPEVSCPYLIAYLWEMGPTLESGMGPGLLTQTEIRAWQENSGIELQPWEARFMRRLSFEWLIEMDRAKEPDCPPPWQPGEPDRAAVANTMLNAIRAMTEG